MHTDKTINYSTKPICPKCGREIPTDEIVAEKDRAWCPNCRREMSFVEVADYSLVKAKRKEPLPLGFSIIADSGESLVYSIQATWNTMIQRGIVYRKYAEIPLFTKSGIQVIKTDSAMEFVVTVPGAMGAAGSVLLDYKSLFSDVYEMSDMIFNDEEADR